MDEEVKNVADDLLKRLGRRAKETPAPITTIPVHHGIHLVINRAANCTFILGGSAAAHHVPHPPAAKGAES